MNRQMLLRCSGLQLGRNEGAFDQSAVCKNDVIRQRFDVLPAPVGRRQVELISGR